MVDEKTVLELIAKGQEGGYWDFKEEWHNNKSSLLHDIICLANNLERRDGYLIIGVKDDSSITGIDLSDTKRKNTQQLTDFLRDKSFVGSVRPIARVLTIELDEDKIIDVITIESERHVPFVLADDYRDGSITVRTGNVYTRIQDTNTPVNATADNDKLEQLWRKRFGMDKSPLEKVQYYLQSPDDWEKADEEARGIYYYKYAPEYSIVFSPDEDRDRDQSDFLCKVWPDSAATWTRGVIKVYNHTLYEFYHAYLDGGRIHLIVPDWKGIKISGSSSALDGKYITMTHLVKGSFKHLVNEFLINKRSGGFDHSKFTMWSSYVITFESEQEKQSFESYIKAHKEEIKDKLNNTESHRTPGQGRWTEVDDNDWKSMEVLRPEFDIWKADNEV
jgi:hypothetical protein